jgi:hypothetical protein
VTASAAVALLLQRLVLEVQLLRADRILIAQGVPVELRVLLPAGRPRRNLGDLLDVLLLLRCLLADLLALGLDGFAFSRYFLRLARVVGVASGAGLQLLGCDALRHGELLAADLDFLVFLGCSCESGSATWSSCCSAA